MVSSIARRMGGRVVVVDQNGVPRWNPIWGGLPYIVAPDDRAGIARGVEQWSGLVNAPGSRHYYTGMKDNRIQWRKWDIAPGEIRLTDEEREWAAREFETDYDTVVIEPNFKATGGGGANKDWGFDKWQAAVDSPGRDHFYVQLLYPGARRLDNSRSMLWYAEPPTFRHACAILERSIGYVGHEGGLHHAAAALGKRAVVVFGGYISPEITGYPNHKNLYVESDDYPLGCGSVAPCGHCRAAMDAITVEQVVDAVKEMVRGGA